MDLTSLVVWRVTLVTYLDVCIAKMNEIINGIDNESMPVALYVIIQTFPYLHQMNNIHKNTSNLSSTDFD